MDVRKIDKNTVILFVRRHHYSNIMPKLTKNYLGFFEGEHLVGIVTLGWGTQPLGTIRKIFPNHNLSSKDYLEIGKMAFLPDNNNDRMTGSIIIKHLKKWIKANTKAMFLYTMADGIMGRVGYVYQASNFKYIGCFKTSVYLDTKTGEKIHPRSARKLLLENATEEGRDKLCWLTDSFCKRNGIDKINGLMFRYIMPLTKEAHKILDSYSFQIKNPKNEDLIYERKVSNGKYEKIEKPNFDMRVSNYNCQKWGHEQIDIWGMMEATNGTT